MISARPHFISLSGKDVSKLTSDITILGWWKDPTKFFPCLTFIAVLVSGSYIFSEIESDYSKNIESLR